MRVLLIGASGVVGQLLCAELRQKTGWTIGLAGRRRPPLEALAATFSPPAAVVPCDVEIASELAAALKQFRPELVVSVVGNYTQTGVNVARTCLQAGVMFLDICDEPKPMAELRGLHAEAVAAGVPLIIGGGTAPQTSSALFRLIMERSGPGVDVRFGYVLGLNRYGANAVQTVSRGVSGLMSHDEPRGLWTIGPVIPFPAPFRALAIRRYPVPETVFLEDWPGVKHWYAGARLSFGWLNAYIRLLQQLGMTQWGVARFWNLFVAALFRGLYWTNCATRGIAIGIEAEKDGRIVRGQLYHPEMSRLTAYALSIALDDLSTKRPDPGVWWGHEVVNPQTFLQRLEAHGVQWSISEHRSVMAGA